MRSWEREGMEKILALLVSAGILLIIGADKAVIQGAIGAIFVVFLLTFLWNRRQEKAERDRILDWLHFPEKEIPKAERRPEVQKLLQCCQEQFWQQKEMEEEKEKQMRINQDYYTLWTHQIKTPIAAMKLLIDQMEEGKERNCLRQELFKTGQYVELMLSYQRMATFHEDLNLQEEHLEELVRAAVKKFSFFFIYQKLSVQIEIGDTKIVTDKKWFAVILEQILSNALKYTQEGGISVWWQEECLFIKDTGIGIRKEDIPRVFERGFCGYNGRMHQQSSGIGLYLSQEIAGKLGYAITIDSETGKGTTVCIHMKQPELIRE